LFINENGTHTAAQETIATTSSTKIYKYEKVTTDNFSSTAMIFNYNSTTKKYEQVGVNPDLYYKEGGGYIKWEKTESVTSARDSICLELLKRLNLFLLIYISKKLVTFTMKRILVSFQKQ
jgi:hypothetical protein